MGLGVWELCFPRGAHVRASLKVCRAGASCMHSVPCRLSCLSLRASPAAALFPLPGPAGLAA